ncbi:MAG: hypothetical protein JO056_08890 [Alphaproteobacteria bacterium]|nr:hypothetical protein [Alphaproteobacteria bacterium]
MSRHIEIAAAVTLWAAGVMALVLKHTMPPASFFELAQAIYVCLAVGILAAMAWRRYSAKS